MADKCNQKRVIAFEEEAEEELERSWRTFHLLVAYWSSMVKIYKLGTETEYGGVNIKWNTYR